MARAEKPKGTVVDVRPAGEDHAVVTVEGGRNGHCAQPCADCPWRKDAVGVFPAEAFRHSASTAYDMARNTFACHSAGTQSPKVCAGFLLRGAEHNLAVRLGLMKGQFQGVRDGGHELHTSYRAMAIANGVSPDDPVLTPCR